jgi:NitT/TauT family transport system substrate-binding protein
VLVGFIAGGAALAMPAVARAQSGVLRVGANPAESYAEPYYGLDAGIFARAGLNVELNAFPNGGAIAQAVTAGAIDIGPTDVIQVANAFIRNVPIVYFAPGVLYSSTAPTSALCAPKDSPIRSAKDLEGQTVAVNSVKSMPECATREWIRKNGGDSAKVRFVEVPPQAIVAVLLRGTVAASIISEPALSQALDDVRVLAKAYDSVAPRFFINSFAARRDWIAANPATARRFADAVRETARWSNTHHAETAATLSKYAKIEPDRLRRMTRATFGETLDDRWIQPVIDIAVRYEIVARTVAASDITIRV